MMYSYLLYFLIDTSIEMICKDAEFRMKLVSDLIVGRKFKVLRCTIWLGEDKSMYVLHGSIIRNCDGEVLVRGIAVIAGECQCHELWCIDACNITSVEWK